MSQDPSGAAWLAQARSHLHHADLALRKAAAFEPTEPPLVTRPRSA